MSLSPGELYIVSQQKPRLLCLNLERKVIRVRALCRDASTINAEAELTRRGSGGVCLTALADRVAVLRRTA